MVSCNMYNFSYVVLNFFSIYVVVELLLSVHQLFKQHTPSNLIITISSIDS